MFHGYSNSPVDRPFATDPSSFDGGPRTIVKICGELDAASRGSVTRRCTEGHAPVVTVDLSELTFLDSGGYSAFSAARTTLDQQQRALVLIGAVGEPRRFLDLIALLDSEPNSLRWHL